MTDETGIFLWTLVQTTEKSPHFMDMPRQLSFQAKSNYSAL